MLTSLCSSEMTASSEHRILRSPETTEITWGKWHVKQPSKQDCTETIWAHVVHRFGELAKAPKWEVPTFLVPGLPGLSQCPFWCGQSVQQGGHRQKALTVPLVILRIWGQEGHFQSPLTHPYTDPHNTPGSGGTHMSSSRNCSSGKASIGLRADGELSNPDLSKSGPVYLIFNPNTSKPSYYHTNGQMAEWNDLPEVTHTCKALSYYHLLWENDSHELQAC